MAYSLVLCLLISISFYVAAARTVDLLTLIFVNPAYWAIGTTFAILSGIFFIIWLLKVSANLEKAGKLKPL